MDIWSGMRDGEFASLVAEFEQRELSPSWRSGVESELSPTRPVVVYGDAPALKTALRETDPDLADHVRDALTDLAVERAAVPPVLEITAPRPAVLPTSSTTAPHAIPSMFRMDPCSGRAAGRRRPQRNIIEVTRKLAARLMAAGRSPQELVSAEVIRDDAGYALETD